MTDAESVDFEYLKIIANGYLGWKYKLGGNDSLKGIDCSAFTKEVFKRTFNIDLKRRAMWQAYGGFYVRREDLRIGDLVFFGPNLNDIDHVGIYMGNGDFINATSSKGVMYSPLSQQYWADKYLFAKRYVITHNKSMPKETFYEETFSAQ